MRELTRRSGHGVERHPLERISCIPAAQMQELRISSLWREREGRQMCVTEHIYVSRTSGGLRLILLTADSDYLKLSARQVPSDGR
jgi:hypothetical protein